MYNWRGLSWARSKPTSSWRVDPAALVEAGVVGLWMFNEQGGQYAYNVVESTPFLATLDGTGVLGVPGQFGPCYKSDSTAATDISLNNTGTVNVLKPQDFPVTMGAWVYFTAADSASGQTILANDSPGFTAGGGFDIITDGAGHWEVDVFPAGAGGGGRRSKITAAAWAQGVWYRVVAVYRGTTDMTIWVNGTDAGGTHSGTGAGLAYTTSRGFVSGTFSGWTTSLVGLIDLPFISKTGWSQPMVQRDYQEPFWFLQPQAPRRLFSFAQAAPATQQFNAGWTQTTSILRGGIM